MAIGRVWNTWYPMSDFHRHMTAATSSTEGSSLPVPPPPAYTPNQLPAYSPPPLGWENPGAAENITTSNTTATNTTTAATATATATTSNARQWRVYTWTRTPRNVEAGMHTSNTTTTTRPAVTIYSVGNALAAGICTIIPGSPQSPAGRRRGWDWKQLLFALFIIAFVFGTVTMVGRLIYYAGDLDDEDYPWEA